MPATIITNKTSRTSKGSKFIVMSLHLSFMFINGFRSGDPDRHPSQITSCDRRFARWLLRWHRQSAKDRHPAHTAPAGGFHRSRRKPGRRISSRHSGEWHRCTAGYRCFGPTELLGPLRETAGKARIRRASPYRIPRQRCAPYRPGKSGFGQSTLIPLLNVPSRTASFPERKVVHAEVHAGTVLNYWILQRFDPEV